MGTLWKKGTLRGPRRPGSGGRRGRGYTARHRRPLHRSSWTGTPHQHSGDAGKMKIAWHNRGGYEVPGIVIPKQTPQISVPWLELLSELKLLECIYVFEMYIYEKITFSDSQMTLSFVEFCQKKRKEEKCKGGGWYTVYWLRKNFFVYPNELILRGIQLNKPGTKKHPATRWVVPPPSSLALDSSVGLGDRARLLRRGGVLDCQRSHRRSVS